MLKKSKEPKKRGRPILVEFDLSDDRRIARFAAARGLKRASAVRLLTLQSLGARDFEPKAEGAA
jgi:hypothetical protein